MAAGGVPGDGQAQPDSLGVLVPGLIEAVEGPEGFFTAFGGDARAIVVDPDGDPRSCDLDLHPDLLAMDDGIADQVGEGALQAAAPASEWNLGGRRDRHLRAGPSCALGGFPDQSRDVQVDRLLSPLPAGEGQVLIDHVLHLNEVLLHGLCGRSGLGKGEFKAQPGQGRAQVVADRGQQGRPLLDMPLDTSLHGQEGLGGLAHLAGAVRLEGRGVPAPTEVVRRLGEALDGPDLVADEQKGDPGEDQGRRRHPAQEDQALGGHGALLGRQDPEDPTADLYPDVHIGRVAGGVEPDGGVDPRRQGLPERGVHRHQGVPAAGFRQGPVRLEGDGQAHGPLRAARRPRKASRGRIILVAFQGPGDVAGQAFRQPHGHRPPVGVEEDPGYRQLHEGDGQDDDQEGSPVERRRQAALDQPPPGVRGRTEAAHQSGASR